MIVWSRFGFIVPLLWLALVGIASALNLQSFVSKPLDASIILIISAAFYWVLGKKINKNTKFEAIEKQTGQAVTIDNSHTFFFIKVEYWSIIAILFAIYIYFNPN